MSGSNIQVSSTGRRWTSQTSTTMSQQSSINKQDSIDHLSNNSHQQSSSTSPVSMVTVHHLQQHYTNSNKQLTASTLSSSSTASGSTPTCIVVGGNNISSGNTTGGSCGSSPASRRVSPVSVIDNSDRVIVGNVSSQQKILSEHSSNANIKNSSGAVLSAGSTMPASGATR